MTNAPGPPARDEEPDVRFTYANERTFLAWNRTALALIATGVAATQLLPRLSVTGGRRLLGLPLIALGAFGGGRELPALAGQPAGHAARRTTAGLDHAGHPHCGHRRRRASGRRPFHLREGLRAAR